jgi:anti-anti-sigma regulatory factor
MLTTRRDSGRADDGCGELTEVVDGRIGTVRARGRLTRAGADLLRGSVVALQGLGHSRVVLDLRGLESIDADGLRELHVLQQETRAAGGELVLLDLTGPIGAGPVGDEPCAREPS